MKRVVCLMLVICLLTSGAFAEGEQSDSFFGAIGDWLSQAADDTSNWVTQAWNDSSQWVSQAWEDTSEWVAQAWNDSSKWVSQAWSDSSDWVSANWDNFVVWINTITAGNPYSWINDMIGEDGLIAYESFVTLRTFLESSPNQGMLRAELNNKLGELSFLNEDKDTFWSNLQSWSNDHHVEMDQTVKLVLPYIIRLIIRGSAEIGPDAMLSGSVVTKYLVTLLETMNVDSSDAAGMKLKILMNSLNGLTRPIVVGDTEQNILVTDDHYYIENFTYQNGKYHVIMVASQKNNDSDYPLINGNSLEEIINKYMKQVSSISESSLNSFQYSPSRAIQFTTVIGEEPVTGRAVAVWAENYRYVLFFVTNHEWKDEEYSSWLASISIVDGKEITFQVDMESDGAFAGISQDSQAYTIKRYFTEAKFLVPKTGHGWAAERGNNLIDNLKGIFKGQHSTITGDNNMKNGPDRMLTIGNEKIAIQTKYCSNANRTIDACFENGKFRYYYKGEPMSIEVPKDQYDEAVRCMENRIRNNEVPGVTDTSRAKEIVRPGHLTYKQAQHIAKAGTVESITYDAAHACVTSATALGISAAVEFAIHIWNGEPVDKAMEASIYRGIDVGGMTFLVSVLSSQLLKTGLNSAMVPASEAIARSLGNKAGSIGFNIVKALTGKEITGGALTKSLGKLLRGNIVTSVLTVAVVSGKDVADIIQGKISWTQLAKNVAVTAASVAGGSVGYLAGAALGTAILPGAGTVVGLIIGAASGWGASVGASALADLIAEDDAKAMIRIIEEQFTAIAGEYFLTEEEINKAVTNLQGILTAQTLKEMFQYKDRQLFARQLIEMAIDPVYAERAYVELPDDEEYSEAITEVLEEIDEADENEEPAA